MGGSSLYLGQVMHKRMRPFRHRFEYRVFSLLLDLDELAELPKRHRLFSVDRPNLFAFYNRDHGPRDGTPLKPWVLEQLRLGGIALGEGGRVSLLCFPRLFGYAFNPLSIYYCHRADGTLAAIFYEVRNTFGEWHDYLLAPAAGRRPGEPVVHGCDKAFYVSPFIGMTARYRFRLTEPAERLSVLIREEVPEGEILVATLVGQRRPLSDRALFSAFLRHPLMTAKVMAAIHWEALKLWIKGARYHARPAPPDEAITFGPPAGPATAPPAA